MRVHKLNNIEPQEGRVKELGDWLHKYKLHLQGACPCRTVLTLEDRQLGFLNTVGNSLVFVKSQDLKVA